jgi:hypothetical protein
MGWRRTLAACATVFAMGSADAGAQVLGAQDFDSLTDGNTTTEQLPDGSTLGGAATMNAVPANGMTFVSVWNDTRGEGMGPVTASDTSDFIGVNSFGGAGSPNVAADGTPVASGSEHNYQVNDADGRLDVVFDPIDLSGFSAIRFSMSYWINSTGYESGDLLRVTLGDGTTTATLLSLTEPGLEQEASPDDGTANWRTLDVDVLALGLTDLTNVSLVVSVDVNAADENIFFDDVLFLAFPPVDVVSGVLEGRRVSKLTCEIVNKADRPIAVESLSLKRPDGTTLAGPTQCSGLPQGASCTLAYDIVLPALDVAAYCHALVPHGVFARGSFRLEDSMSNTQAESDLVGDVQNAIHVIEQVMHTMCPATLALTPCVSDCPVPTTDLATGVLEARRVSSLTCSVINKSGTELAGITISLKRPDGSTLTGPLACGGVAHGATCNLTYDIVYPSLDVAAYCHVQVPQGSFVHGNLRYENAGSMTLASSPLQANTLGMMRDLAWWLGDNASACVDP